MAVLLAATLFGYLPAGPWRPSGCPPSRSPPFPSFADPAVATDVDCNSIAVGIDQDESRPRSGGLSSARRSVGGDYDRPRAGLPAAHRHRGACRRLARRLVRRRLGRLPSESDDVLCSVTRSPAARWTTEDVGPARQHEITDFEAGADGSVMPSPWTRGRRSRTRSRRQRALGRGEFVAPATSAASPWPRTAVRWRSVGASAASRRASARAIARRAESGPSRRRWGSSTTVPARSR